MTDSTRTKNTAKHQSTIVTRSELITSSSGSLIQVHGRSLWTTSHVVADKFNKRHSNVIRSIENLECSSEFSQLNFEKRDFLDERGKLQKTYDTSRDGFSILAMGFTGKGAARWKEQFIAAFGSMERELPRIANRKADPALKIVNGEKSAAAILMTDCLQDARAEVGKETMSHHYATEHSLCSWVLTGSFGSLNPNNLDVLSMRLMAKIRRRNAVLIIKCLDYKKRKFQLREEFPLIEIAMLEAA
jgi:Rha family phage regulatory protein